MSDTPKLIKCKMSKSTALQRKFKGDHPAPDRSISIMIIGRFGFRSEGLRRILECNHFINIHQAQILDRSNYSRAINSKIIIFNEINYDIALSEMVLSIRSQNLAARILVLIDENSPGQFENAASIPAHAFLSVNISPASLIKTLDVIFGNGSVLSDKFADYLALHHNIPETKVIKAAPTEQHFSLSSREVDIIKCLTDGCSNKHIARQFGIAESTVKIHVKNILRKINVRNRTQAAIWALAQYPHSETIELACPHSVDLAEVRASSVA